MRKTLKSGCGLYMHMYKYFLTREYTDTHARIHTKDVLLEKIDLIQIHV